MRSAIAAGAVAVMILAAAPPEGAARMSPQLLEAVLVNRGVVELETGGATVSAIRFAEDIASIIDDGETRRVVPVIGKGSLQNLTDLRYLRGIDIAIVQSDALDYAREQRLLPGIDGSLTFIAKLYNEEFHLLVGPEIKTIEDLANRMINVDLRGSGTAITATRLFGLLNLPVTMTNDTPDVALERLRKGDIAAVALLSAKPAPFLQDLKPGDGLHFLAVPLSPAVAAAYAPTRLTAEDYPTLVAPDQPVVTIAVGSVMLTANPRTIPDRYNNIAGFVDAFFTGFQTLLEPGHHPKWQEVNLAAEVPGWQRYPPAQQWLQRNMASAPSADALRVLFSRFVDERRLASGGAPMTTDEKEALFQQFRDWQRGQVR
jgi:uncharacterized protein